MKTATILILVAMLIMLALFGFGSCRADSPGVSLSWQNDSQAQETERLRISEAARTERTRIEAEHGWRPWATIVALAVIGAAAFIGYNWIRRPAASQVTVNVFAPPPQVAGWLAQNPEWEWNGETWAVERGDLWIPLESIPTTRRLTG